MHSLEALPVSTVIPTYNRAEFIGRAVGSALAASSREDEVIVVDDGSTDNTEEVLAPYRDRIRYIHTPHRGAGASRNCGIDEAKYPLIAFLDSDDEWMPFKLELQRSVMKAYPDVIFCFSDFRVRVTSGEEHRCYLSNWHRDSRTWNEILGPGYLYSSIADVPSGQEDFYVYVGNLYPSEMKASYVSTITLLVRHEEAGISLRFAEDLPLYEDWECIGRLTSVGPAAYLDCETAWNHGHQAFRLTDADLLTKATARIKVLQRVWGSDAEFLAKHADIYEWTIKEQHVLRARALISLGRIEEAREALQLAGGGPLTYRFLASLPNSMVHNLQRLWRTLAL